MNKGLLVLLLLLVAVSARAQALSSTWTDITAAPYYAARDCSADAGVKINSAISSAPAGSGVIFFPVGCYLIQTQILDANASAYLTYLGFGHVELRAGSSLGGSIIKFGGDTGCPSACSKTVTRRNIKGLYFNCNDVTSLDGIDLDGFINSTLDDIEVRNCPGKMINTVGINGNLYTNVVNGGVFAADAAGQSGIALCGGANQAGCNKWTFNSPHLSGVGSGATGFAIEVEGYGNLCIGCDVEGWGYGWYQLGTSGGTEISGGYWENNQTADMRFGTAGTRYATVEGIEIHGAYMNGFSVTPNCIDLQQTNATVISANYFYNCATNNVHSWADGTYQGGENVQVSNNQSTGSGAYSLLGTTNNCLERSCERAVFATFLPGNLVGGVQWNQTTLDRGVTVTRIEMSSESAMPNCSVAPTIMLTDGTTAISLTVANQLYSSATFSQSYAPGKTLKVNTTAGTCATPPNNVNVIVTFQMQ